MPKTTKKHFELFCREVKKWQATLGLHRWEVDCRHKKFERENWYASCTFDVDALHAYIDLNTEWNMEVTKDQIERSAFHEVCHLLLGKLELMGQWRFVREDEFMPEVHIIIRTLENVVFE